MTTAARSIDYLNAEIKNEILNVTMHLTVSVFSVYLHILRILLLFVYEVGACH